MRGINSFIVDISTDGIIASGGVYGTFAPGIDRLFTTYGIGEDLLRIYVRTVPITETISNVGNNTFILPVAFGLNKAVIFINGEGFIPEIDYTISGNLVTWLYPDVAITPSDSVIAWGPANDYTANAITFEYFNLSDTTVYTINELLDDHCLLNLKGSAGTSSFPYNQTSIYLMVNGKSYIPGTDKDFHYLSDTKQISWHGSDHPHIVPATDRIFTFYYNQILTPPFRLGEILVRQWQTAVAEDDGVFVLNSPLSPTLGIANNIFMDKLRYVNTVNYRFKPLLFTWLPSGGAPFNEGSVLDISYFADLNFGLDFFNARFDGNNYVNDIAAVIDVPVSGGKGLLFMNGSLCINSIYANTTDPAAADYELVPAGVHWISSTFDVTAADKFIWSGFKDIFSSSYIQINYFTSVAGAIAIPLAEVANTDKIIVWLNGQAKFTQTSELTVADGTVTVADFDAVVSDNIVTFHFNNADYANLWEFEKISLGNTDPWLQSISKSLATDKAAKTQTTLWLFINGFLAIPGVDWELDGPGTSIKNIGMGSLPVNTDVMAVYLRK